MTTLIDTDSALNEPAQLSFMLTQINLYFQAYQTQPPLPANLDNFLPCRLLITQESGASYQPEGAVGRVQIIKDKSVVYDKTWPLKIKNN